MTHLCKSCGRQAKQLCVDCLASSEYRRLERMALGVLRSTIDAHGPITMNHIGSAARRLAAQWQSLVKQRHEQRESAAIQAPS